MIVNYQLDVNEFDDSSGTAEPWVVVYPIVWYTHDPATAYDGYSLLLKDGDSGDPDPIDMFAQGFQMPGNLTEIEIEFRRATINSNSTDKVYGELWKLDDDWVLHLDQADKYYVAGWEVAESEGAWAKQTVTIHGFETPERHVWSKNGYSAVQYHGQWRREGSSSF